MMKKYKLFYVWVMNTKLFMGIYFTALVFFVGVLLACFGQFAVKTPVLLEILGAAICIALAQAILLPDSTDFMQGIFFARSLGWLVFSGVVAGGAALAGGWLAGLPAWCALVLALATMLGCLFALVGLRWEQEQDTLHLNRDLENYKQQ